MLTRVLMKFGFFWKLLHHRTNYCIWNIVSTNDLWLEQIDINIRVYLKAVGEAGEQIEESQAGANKATWSD